MAEGATGGTRIERLKKGDKTRTAQHADVMNEIIDKLNALWSMQVVPGTAGEFFYSDGNVVLLSNAGTVTVTTGDTSGGVDVSTLSGVTTITFDQDLFSISDGGNGTCFVDLQTEECP